MSVAPQKRRKDASEQVRVVCDNCGASLRASVRQLGRRATCPECGATLDLPDRDDLVLRREIEALRKKPEQVADGAEPDGMSRRPALREGTAGAPPAMRADRPGERQARLPAPQSADPRAPLPDESHAGRAKLAGWLRRVAIIALALVIIAVLDAAVAAFAGPASVPGFHGIFAAAGDQLRSVPAALHNLVVPRSVALGSMSALERFVLSVVLLILSARLIIRAKLLDSVFVTAKRWHHRTNAGLVASFLVVLLQAWIIAWAASVIKASEGSDGLACGLLALELLLSAVWMFALHLQAGDEYQELAWWTATDATFAAAIIVVILCPGLTMLWSRAGATGVLGGVNAVLGLSLGASFTFARTAKPQFLKRLLSLTALILGVGLTALLLACVR